jgi:uncharacterized membrane-anchored protein YhcB (DUF1043 family)
MKRLQIRFLLIVALIGVMVIRVTGQTPMPDVFTQNSVKDQMNYLEEHTKIYENYRAVREDMFQKIKKNVTDTITNIHGIITGLNKTKSGLNQTIDTLRSDLKSTKSSLDEMTKTKNSISILGFEVNKLAYNRVMWTIIVGLVAVFLIGFLVFKRNLTLIQSTKNELQDLKTEFEAYRKSSREAREKLTMDHFNEIKRLKGG